ncbi:DUF7344 domain-containing protein [Geoglobus acetivorans]|uniref:DUF7344 domain-containing protein n=1 Tax=Geoglobus acetivorans TaxID=565033 RepID=A0ABZ3H1V9_GEOAI|nr:hypothetical protein [Geoglobus acetivorans]
MTRRIKVMANLSEIIGNERRMLMIIFLLENDGNATVREITNYIVEKNKKDGHKFRKSVYVSLKQTHIPMLEREGFLRMERDRVIVENSKLFSDFVSLLQAFKPLFFEK